MKTRVNSICISQSLSTAVATGLVVLVAAATNVSAQVAGVAFTTQPGSATAGAPFGQPAVLRTVDQFGTPTTTGLPAVMLINVALTNSAGTLSGKTSYNIGTSDSNGIVTLTDLTVSAAGSGNQLIAWVGAASPPVTGANLWLDANDAASLTVNGTAVSAWNNKGSIGSALTQNNAASQPTLTAGALSGKPVVTFNGTSTYLVSLNSAYNNSGNQMTYFVVTRMSNTNISWRGPVSFAANGQVDGWGVSGVVILTDGTSGNQLSIQRHHQGTPLQAVMPLPAANTAFVMTFADNAGTAGLYYLAANGATRTNSANIVNGISPYTYGINDVAVGGRLETNPTISANYWPGAVAEVLVYNTALTAVERSAVQNYLANKWFTTLAPSSALSAAFTVSSSGSNPPRQNITSVKVNGDGSVTLIYATTAGFNYHIEVSPTLASGSWTTIAGSAVAGTGGAVTFTDTTSIGNSPRFYRTVSP